MVTVHYQFLFITKLRIFFKRTLKIFSGTVYGSKTKLRNSNAIPLLNVLESLNLDSSHFLNAVLNPTICHSKAVVSIGSILHLFCALFEQWSISVKSRKGSLLKGAKWHFLTLTTNVANTLCTKTNNNKSEINQRRLLTPFNHSKSERFWFSSLDFISI